jgi:hypothetical protein
MQVLDIGKNAIYNYGQDQLTKQKKFALDNSMPLPDYAKNFSAFNDPSNASNVGCTDSYPVGALYKNGNDLINMGYINYQQREAKRAGGETTRSVPLAGSPFDSERGLVPLGGQIEEGFENQPTNDPTSEMLLDMKTRPMTDFLHNNMVPFYGAAVKQNMAGTGVASGNYIDGVNVNSGFDDETPYVNKLQTFTGLDDTYLHKREIGPKFSPAEQQTNWVNGSPLARPDDDRYTVSLFKRHDLAPCEQEIVGPGLDLDPSIPSSGGFHEFTRIMPNNVNDYKMHQLEGRVITQGWQLGGQEPTAYPGAGTSTNDSSRGVTKNRPNSFWTQARYPTMTTKASPSVQGDLVIPDYDVAKRPGNANREQINYGFGSIVYKNTIPPQQTQRPAKPAAYNFDISDLNKIEGYENW